MVLKTYYKYIYNYIYNYSIMDKEIIILTIASRGNIYDKFLSEYWIPMIKYSKKKYNNIKIYLLFGKDTYINDLEEIKDNIIVTPYDESYKNILEKTLYAFDYCLKTFKFDFIFRTNLSSFIILNKLIDVTKNINQNNYIGGIIGNHGGIKFIGGAGIWFSNDVINNIIINRNLIINDVIDDVDLGKYLQDKYTYNPLPRFDIITYNNISIFELNRILNYIINTNQYHIRLKNPNRLVDIQTAMFLTKYFYK